MSATVLLAAALVGPLVGSPVGPLSAVVSPCAPGAAGPAVEVTVHGFKDRSGRLRIAIYPASDADFLAPARYVRRIDAPLTASGAMTLCAPVPAAGELIVVALHDRDANGKFSPFRDGVGFSRNPRLRLAKPAVAAVKVHVDGVTPLSIELNYLHGLKVRPVRSKHNP